MASNRRQARFSLAASSNNFCRAARSSTWWDAGARFGSLIPVRQLSTCLSNTTAESAILLSVAESRAWAAWALEQADRIDPFVMEKPSSVLNRKQEIARSR